MQCDQTNRELSESKVALARALSLSNMLIEQLMARNQGKMESKEHGSSKRAEKDDHQHNSHSQKPQRKTMLLKNNGTH